MLTRAPIELSNSIYTQIAPGGAFAFSVLDMAIVEGFFSPTIPGPAQKGHPFQFRDTAYMNDPNPFWAKCVGQFATVIVSY
ncbi:MAG: hypothetical protein ACEQSB_00415 [Undibacterium sp.]